MVCNLARQFVCFSSSMKIALAQFNPTVGDFAGNSSRILSLSSQAHERGAGLVVFSELCLCGYFPLDLLERPAFIDRNHRQLKELAAKIPVPSIVGYAGRVKNGTGKSIANKAALICAGRVVFEQSKMLLPTYDVFDETRYFQPADRQYVFGLDGEQLGITICEDVWNDKNFWAKQLYERDPVSEIVRQGSTVLLNLSGSPYALDKRALRFEMLRSIALTHKRPVIYVNQVGGDDSLVFDGASIALTADGKVAAQAKAFEEELVIFDTATGNGEIQEQPREEIAYAYRALVTGTRDYVRKCGFKKVLVGLSGGIDSAVVAAIAVDALGSENVLGVSMPGPFSSPGSKTDAQTLAKNLGIQFLTLPITEVFQAYKGALEPAFGDRPADVTRSEEHTPELQSRLHLVCRLLLEKKKDAVRHLLTDDAGPSADWDALFHFLLHRPHSIPALCPHQQRDEPCGHEQWRPAAAAARHDVRRHRGARSVGNNHRCDRRGHPAGRVWLHRPRGRAGRSVDAFNGASRHGDVRLRHRLYQCGAHGPLPVLGQGLA